MNENIYIFKKIHNILSCVEKEKIALCAVVDVLSHTHTLLILSQQHGCWRGFLQNPILFMSSGTIVLIGFRAVSTFMSQCWPNQDTGGRGTQAGVAHQRPHTWISEHLSDVTTDALHLTHKHGHGVTANWHAGEMKRPSKTTTVKRGGRKINLDEMWVSWTL